eukprot:2228019-Rhodomonas_salina.2
MVAFTLITVVSYLVCVWMRAHAAHAHALTLSMHTQVHTCTCADVHAGTRASWCTCTQRHTCIRSTQPLAVRRSEIPSCSSLPCGPARALHTVQACPHAPVRLAEGPAGEDHSRHLVDQIWFVIVSLTTTGYGDITPSTDIGRAAAVIVMAVGPVVTAFITGTLRAYPAVTSQAKSVLVPVVSQAESRVLRPRTQGGHVTGPKRTACCHVTGPKGTMSGADVAYGATSDYDAVALANGPRGAGSTI